MKEKKMKKTLIKNRADQYSSSRNTKVLACYKRKNDGKPSKKISKKQLVTHRIAGMMVMKRIKGKGKEWP